MFHEAAIKKEIGPQVAILAPSRGPRHFELVSPHEATAGGDRLLLAVDRAEDNLIRKYVRDTLKESAR